MNVITFASRKGGVGQSTLTAHVLCFRPYLGRRCVLMMRPQGSLTLCTMARQWRVAVADAAQGIESSRARADRRRRRGSHRHGADNWVVCRRHSRRTMVVIPVRPGFFDIAAVWNTVRPRASAINVRGGDNAVP